MYSDYFFMSLFEDRMFVLFKDKELKDRLDLTLNSIKTFGNDLIDPFLDVYSLFRSNSFFADLFFDIFYFKSIEFFRVL